MLPRETSKDFPGALKAAREQKGLSRSELAKLAGIHNVMPRRYEEPTSGDFAIPSFKTWKALNEALGFHLENIDYPRVDDIRIADIKELISPQELINEIPISKKTSETTDSARGSIHRILHGADDRLLVIIGPCSIHDPLAAMEYAQKLRSEAQKHQNDLLILMRVYFEKPRTTVGWKGLINDPSLNGSFQISEGLRIARQLLRNINDLGLPAATEFLDMITPQYIGDLVSWGAIGARTTESQVHRQLASGLSCPVGFKNATNGDLQIAVDAIKAAQAPHHFLSVTKSGRPAIVSTTGNEDCHIILRGGKQPNYDSDNVTHACSELAKSGIPAKLVIDFSHANSQKQYSLQLKVGEDVATQITTGENRILGIMCESNLNQGRQDLIPGKDLQYGVSITDGCIGWDSTVQMLDLLASSVQKRRLITAEEQ
jgi:3-deoxy-7-phosphoheptulonate synthase